MLNENIASCRKEKGLSQTELAVQLNVVRQTISKWEKGLSVPDADMIVRIAALFEIPTSKLLGSAIEVPEDKDTLAQKLEQLNLLLTKRNKRSRTILRIVAGILIFFAMAIILCIVLNFTVSGNTTASIKSSVEYTTFSAQSYTEADKSDLGTKQLEQRLTATIEQLESVTAAAVQVEEESKVVTVELQTAKTDPLTETQVLSIEKLIKSAIENSAAYKVEINIS